MPGTQLRTPPVGSPLRNFHSNFYSIRAARTVSALSTARPVEFGVQALPRQDLLPWQLFSLPLLNDGGLEAARLSAIGTIVKSLSMAQLKDNSLTLLLDRIVDGFSDLVPFAGVEAEIRADILNKNYAPADLEEIFPYFLSQNGKSDLIGRMVRESQTVEDVSKKMMGLPLLDQHHNLLGIITLTLIQEVAAFSPQVKGYIKDLREHASIILSTTSQKEQLVEKSIFDALTGVFNMEAFERRLDEAVKNTHRHGDQLALMFLDIDHFKVINDTYGHPFGNRVLVEFAQILKESVREVDLIGRYGGDEFVILLPRTSHDGAMMAAERIRAAFENHVYYVDIDGVDKKGEGIEETVSYDVDALESVLERYLSERVQTTVSIGVTSYHSLDDTWEILLERADEHLRRAKEDFTDDTGKIIRQGRNFVMGDIIGEEEPMNRPLPSAWRDLRKMRRRALQEKEGSSGK